MSLNIKNAKIVSILGSCGSGKTHVVKYIISNNKNIYDYVIIITSTAFTNQYEYLTKLGINYKVLSTMDVDDKIKKIKGYQKRHRETKSLLLIFDDVSITSLSGEIKLLFNCHRHYNMSVFFVAQFATALAPQIRELSNYVIIFNQKTEKSLRAVYENYFTSEVDSFKDFNVFFKNKLKVQYTFFFVDREDRGKLPFIARAPALKHLC